MTERGSQERHNREGERDTTAGCQWESARLKLLVNFLSCHGPSGVDQVAPLTHRGQDRHTHEEKYKWQEVTKDNEAFINNASEGETSLRRDPLRPSAIGLSVRRSAKCATGHRDEEASRLQFPRLGHGRVYRRGTRRRLLVSTRQSHLRTKTHFWRKMTRHAAEMKSRRHILSWTYLVVSCCQVQNCRQVERLLEKGLFLNLRSGFGSSF